MPMKNPRHPGHSIKGACLDPLLLSVTDAARVLRVARLEKAAWSNADHWLRLQAAYDLAQARRHEDAIKAKRYEPQLTS
jgi:plasmid maintenance system antidote protein VapI